MLLFRAPAVGDCGLKKDMATKIRLQRQGRKKRAFFHIVVTDSRAPRNGRFIEKLGTYNPISNPATIDINLDGAVKWLMTGAEPTDTARAILSYKGAMYKKHLQVGVNKGAITQEQADAKFAEWSEAKAGKIQSKKDRLASEKAAKLSDAMKAETAKKEAIAAKVIAKTAEAVVEETLTEEAPAEEVASEETPATEETSTEETAE